MASSEESRNDLLGRLGEALLGLLEVGVPDRAVPDLEARAGTDDRDVTVEPGVLAQVGRDGEATLLVRDLVRGAGEEDAHVVAGRPARRRSLAHLVGDLHELVHRVDEEAALLAAGDDEPGCHALAELRGQEQPALLVETRCVRPQEHGSPPPLARPRGRIHSLPMLATVLHFAPPSMSKRRCRALRGRVSAGHGGGGKWRARRSPQRRVGASAPRRAYRNGTKPAVTARIGADPRRRRTHWPPRTFTVEESGVSGSRVSARRRGGCT